MESGVYQLGPRIPETSKEYEVGLIGSSRRAQLDQTLAPKPPAIVLAHKGIDDLSREVPSNSPCSQFESKSPSWFYQVQAAFILGLLF